jgi:hypothetical protein
MPDLGSLLRDLKLLIRIRSSGLIFGRGHQGTTDQPHNQKYDQANGQCQAGEDREPGVRGKPEDHLLRLRIRVLACHLMNSGEKGVTVQKNGGQHEDQEREKAEQRHKCTQLGTLSGGELARMKWTILPDGAAKAQRKYHQDSGKKQPAEKSGERSEW